LPVQTLKEFNTIGEKGDVFMYIAFGIAFVMIVAAPFVGRWRANAWLQKNVRAEETVSSLVEIA
jgi:hypothetical protein